MKLLTKDIERRLPPLGTNDENPNPVARVKFFTPDSHWTWYGIEYDPEQRIFFGLVHGVETEYGTFSLNELEQVRGPLGLPVERDQFFVPTPAKELE
ncbi:DUF2958 domain-containing protein [Streptomyces ipomoeae]|uniref:DUF2958 domain-containing protein n=1 Tax=Streptomyces ipomoeae TaxID=103232 RepID=UPI0006628BBE|nr:DUF2958 domain-containing protein [Streptomyces ipomoeae]MDX2697471.1 DUF2958 domain-containing protein [Streptomyces ipomoeae]MDX2843202.1 DUF2958 domain-containing protein [Streptomyces ipomoeae]